MKRRTFLARSGGALGGSWVMMSLPAIFSAAATAREARAAGGTFKVLSEDEAREFDAIAAQIIPSGETPGACEAGVIHFMDAALGGVAAKALAPLREGLASLQADVSGTLGADTFASLAPERQIEALKGIEDTSFFYTLRYLTIAGMFSDPAHGGNRNKAGWSLIGFEGPRPWQPPFGHYDAERDAGERES
jgi:hypothetical protein